MKESRVVLGLTAAAVGVGLISAFVGGSLAGFVYPGDLLVWTIALTGGGAIVLRARPGHAIGRLFLWAGLAAALNYLILQIGQSFLPEYAFDMETGTYSEGTPGWFQAVDFVFGTGYAVANVLVIAAFARFPDGQWVARWVGWVFWASVPLVLAANLGILPGAGAIPVLVISVAIVRRSLLAGAVYRRQVAWVLIGYGAFLAVGISSVLLPDGLPPDWLVQSSIIFFPAGMVLAITRYRLFELDRIVSRTVSYVLVIGLLAGMYVLVVVGSRLLLGVEGPLPVALWTLLAAFALFPLARWVQSWVDRRFFRSRYDAASVVSRVAGELRTTVDLAEVEQRASAVVDEVFAPQSVVVWLTDDPA